MADEAIRELLHSAYSFVRGVESNRAIANVTLDHMLQEQIDAIRGSGSRDVVGVDASGKSIPRPSKLAQLDEVATGIDAAVKALEAREEL